jgi:hypothetical protein
LAFGQSFCFALGPFNTGGKQRDKEATANANHRDATLDRAQRTTHNAHAHARTYEIYTHTFVLMFVIFLIAHPSPVRLCLAATTQP